MASTDQLVEMAQREYRELGGISSSSHKQIGHYRPTSYIAQRNIRYVNLADAKSDGWKQIARREYGGELMLWRTDKNLYLLTRQAKIARSRWWWLTHSDGAVRADQADRPHNIRQCGNQRVREYREDQISDGLISAAKCIEILK